MSKKVLVIALALILAIGLFGCAPKEGEEGKAPEGEKLVLASIVQDMRNDHQSFSQKVFRENAAEYGFELLEFDGQNDVTVQAAAIGNAISQGVDVIIVCPADEEAIVPSLMEAKEAGILVGTISSDISENNHQYRDFFCGADHYSAGKLAGEVMVEQFPDGADVVEIGGRAGQMSQVLRHEGFEEAIKGSKINVLDFQCCENWVTPDAMNIMEDFIVKYGDEMDGIFCHWDNGATGVIEAMNVKGLENIFLVAVDGCKAGFDQIKAGTQSVSIMQNVKKIVLTALEVAKKMVNDESFEEINIIPWEIVTLETIDSFDYPEW